MPELERHLSCSPGEVGGGCKQGGAKSSNGLKQNILSGVSDFQPRISERQSKYLLQEPRSKRHRRKATSPKCIAVLDPNLEELLSRNRQGGVDQMRRLLEECRIQKQSIF